MTKTVTVVGAGFSGLTLAYELLENGFDVVLHEQQARAGGLVGTHVSPYGLVETAANALVANKEVEDLFEELGVEFAGSGRGRSRRYIFWECPRRWPLGWAATAKVIVQALRLAAGSETLLPKAGESIADWARRFGGVDFAERLLGPALQGIYAGDPEEMSAVLVLRNLLADKPTRGRRHGSVAPVGGMGTLIEALVKNIQKRGGRLELKSRFAMPEYLTSPTVLATPAWNAADILAESRPEAAGKLKTCQSLGLVTATCFFRRRPGQLKGFGCLFPRSQGFSALGVLFNNGIFDRPGDHRSETWIMGGAAWPEAAAESDAAIVSRVLRDRERLYGESELPVHSEVTHWPRAIPHYNLAWERTLLTLDVAPPLYLHGNYLGDLGLARIYSRSRALAKQIKDHHG